MARNDRPAHSRLISRIDGDEEIADGILIDDEDDLENDEAIAYRKFREQMRESEQYPSISVSRQPMDSDGRRGMRKLAFLFEVGLDDYEYPQLMTKIRDGYGSGSYRLQGRDPLGRLLFNKTVHVEAPQVKETDKRDRDSGSPERLFAAFNSALAAHQERTEQMLERLIGARKSAEGSSLDSMQNFAVMVTMMKELAGTFTGVPSKPLNIVDELKRLGEVREVMKSLTGDGDGGGGEKNIHDTLGAVVNTFAPMLQAGFANMAAQQSRMPRRLPNPNAAPHARPAPVAPLSENNHAEGNESMELSAQVAILVSNAKNGVDPALMAETILNMTPDEKLENLREFIQSPDCLPKMQRTNPAVSQYLPWFEGLRGELLEYFSGEYLQGDGETDTLDASGVPASQSDDAGDLHAIDT